MSKDKQKQTVQTTGHAWDGDLQEFNNPLPNWWLWGFYLTVVFAVIYWVFFPAWPVGSGYTKGIGNDIEYTTREGKVVRTHWNTRALLQKDLMEARIQQEQYLQGLHNVDTAAILKDPAKRGFAFSVAKVLFADNCAACHQTGGAGLPGKYPSLADDDWIWGGSYAQIEQTIKQGRQGNMPGFAARLSATQIDELAEYVLSLSGKVPNPAKTEKGKLLFNGEAGCMACHTREATGNIALGSANLTDQIWTVAEINSQMSHADRKQAISRIISSGISRTMPAWQGRFSETEIRMLTLYVHELGGGK